jgi:carbamoyl-phosphate synthase large subunit
MSPKKFVILRGSVGSPSSGALINEFKNSNFRVVGYDANPFSVGFYLCDNSYVVPQGKDPEFLESILKICDSENPDILCPNTESELLVLSRNKEKLRRKNVLPYFPEYDSVLICADKVETEKKFKEMNIPFAESFPDGEIVYPCILKPRRGKGSQNVFKVNSHKELEFYKNQVTECLIQEYLEGTEYSIDVYSDLDGNPFSIVPRERVSTESGISVKGTTVLDKEIIEYCEKIAKSLKLIGPSCIQCIKNKNNIKFIEVNTRFGGGSILSIKANPTIIPNIQRIIEGDSAIPDNTFKEGLTMLRYYKEIFIEKNNMTNPK